MSRLARLSPTEKRSAPGWRGLVVVDVDGFGLYRGGGGPPKTKAVRRCLPPLSASSTRANEGVKAFVPYPEHPGNETHPPISPSISERDELRGICVWRAREARGFSRTDLKLNISITPVSYVLDPNALFGAIITHKS